MMQELKVQSSIMPICIQKRSIVKVVAFLTKLLSLLEELYPTQEKRDYYAICT